MIVKIHKSNTTMASNLRYNEDKVKREEAEIMWTENIGSMDTAIINEVFAARERSAVRDLAHVSFQMSINPDASDGIKEEDIPAFANEMMNKLGYGDQPWVLFKHHDIAREHYHLVSIRIDEEGKKIRDHFEHKKCKNAAIELSSKYDFTLGHSDAKTESLAQIRRYFEPGMSNIKQVLSDCLDDTLRYNFTSGEEFTDILRAHGITVEEGISINDVLLRFQGLNEYGEKCTPPMTSKELGIDVYGLMRQRVEECYSKDFSKERKKLMGQLYGASRKVNSFRAMKNIMKSQGIELTLHMNEEKDNGHVTIIDHVNMHAFTPKDFSKIMMEYAANDELSDHLNDSDSYSKSVEKQENEQNSPVAALASALGGLLGGGTNAKEYQYLEDNDKKRKRKKGLSM